MKKIRSLVAEAFYAGVERKEYNDALAVQMSGKRSPQQPRRPNNKE
jgi:hypothetical protein